MNNQHTLIERFYTAFANNDYTTMQRCYHDDATFNDPAFKNLSSPQVKAMWQMLITSATDLKVTFGHLHATGCQWQAWYTFSTTGRKVHNIIEAKFEFKDRLIYRHTDRFNFWRWSRMALGTSGLLLGWTPFLQNKVSAVAMERLSRYMQKML